MKPMDELVADSSGEVKRPSFETEQRVTEAVLRARGFEEMEGVFVRHKMRLKDVQATLVDLDIKGRELVPSLPASGGHREYLVDFKGGRCKLTYLIRGVNEEDDNALVKVEAWLVRPDQRPDANPEYLKAKGFTKERNGDFVREKLAIKELRTAFRFTSKDVGKVDTDGGRLRCVIYIHGARCVVDFLGADARLDDEDAIVNARIHIYTAEDYAPAPRP